MAKILHSDEIAITDDLVHRLLSDQFPQHARSGLSRLNASGSSNVLHRLGDDLLVRLPRQPGAGAAIRKEQAWLPTIAPCLPVATPEIIALGQPAHEYPEHWSIVRWLEGVPVTPCLPGAPPDASRLPLAEALAELILALRQIDVPDTAQTDPALRWYRGAPLAAFDQATRRNLNDCRAIDGLDLDLDAALELWNEAVAQPDASVAGPAGWYHGDLVAENLLLADGKLSAVLDFGGLGVGDPTIDLHGTWEVLDGPGRKLFRERLGVDDAQWLRGRAWAMAVALSTFPYYWKTMPERVRARHAMAQSALLNAAI